MEYREEDDYDFYWSNIEIADLKFVLTCSACPEQYDVYLEDEQIGYVRLRRGHLRAYYPDVGGKAIYSSEIGDTWAGCFTNEKERIEHLTKIALALKEAHLQKHKSV